MRKFEFMEVRRNRKLRKNAGSGEWDIFKLNYNVWIGCSVE